jgi:hypothetical protein
LDVRPSKSLADEHRGRKTSIAAIASAHRTFDVQNLGPEIDIAARPAGISLDRHRVTFTVLVLAIPGTSGGYRSGDLQLPARNQANFPSGPGSGTWTGAEPTPYHRVAVAYHFKIDAGSGRYLPVDPDRPAGL